MFQELYARYYAPKLSPRELRQLSTGVSSKFLAEFIAPNVHRPDRGDYVSVSHTAALKWRDETHSRGLLARPLTDPAWLVNSVFANPMKLAAETSPSDKIIMGEWVALTLEFDDPDLEFFQRQLSWFRSPKHLLDAPIGAYVKDLREEFADFLGLCVVYSGNKSFHYHHIFSTDLLAGTVGRTPVALRQGYMAAWHTVADKMCAALAIDAEADASLRLPEQYRRLPGGIRVVDKPGHMFDVAVGEMIPQTCVWEAMFKRAGRGATSSVFDASTFLTPVHASGRSSSRSFRFNAAPDVLDYARERMAEIYSGEGDAWPKFHDFSMHEGQPRAVFFNGPADRKPDSFQDVAYRAPLIVGRSLMSNPSTMPRLPAPLGEMLDRWARDVEALSEAPVKTARSPVEERFAEKAKDAPTAVAAIGEVIDRIMSAAPLWSDRVDLISAPEGVSKTRTLIAETPRLVHRLVRGGGCPLIAYAFMSYDLAGEKCREFNAAHGAQTYYGRRFRGVVLKSFSRVYEEACDVIGVTPFTQRLAAEGGFASVYAAIVARQPVVLTRVRGYYARLRRELRGAYPVLFLPHAVAHQWPEAGLSRLMLSKGFWSGDIALAKRETELGLLIHDEVSPDDLLDMVAEEVAEWIEGLKAGDPALWGEGALNDRLAAYLAYSVDHPRPDDLTFEVVCKLAAGIPPMDWQQVTTKASGEYPAREDRDIYGTTVGRVWRVRPRGWWTRRTLLLTTEAVPTIMARKLGFSVTELETPHIVPDPVDVVISPKLTAKTLPAYCAQLVAGDPSLTVVSNRAATVVGTVTHAKAKGSNAYMARPLAQTMTMAPPALVERLEVLNAWADRDDLIRLSHIDTINQTCGRNLGFRRRDGATHTLHIYAALWAVLQPLLHVSRYALIPLHSRGRVRGLRSRADESRASRQRLVGLRKALIAVRDAA